MPPGRHPFAQLRPRIRAPSTPGRCGTQGNRERHIRVVVYHGQPGWCSPPATRARDDTPLRLAQVPRTEHAGYGSSFPLTGSGSRGGPRGVWSPRSAPLFRRVDWPSRTGEARSAVVHGQGLQSPADRRFYVMPVAERPAVSQGSQSVGTDGHQLSRRSVRDCCDGPAGGLTIMGPDLLQLTGHVVKRDDVASLEDVSNHVIGPVLALRPQPQCGKQVRGFVDEVAAGVGVAQLVVWASISRCDRATSWSKRSIDEVSPAPTSSTGWERMPTARRASGGGPPPQVPRAPGQPRTSSSTSLEADVRPSSTSQPRSRLKIR